MQQTRIAKALLTVFVISTAVKIAIFIREGADGSFKVSLRSKDVGDVCRIANKFAAAGMKERRIHGMAAPFNRCCERDRGGNCRAEKG